MKIQISKIIPSSRVDGPGVRTALFLQGCSLACPGCQSRHLWDSAGGRAEPAQDVALTLATLSFVHGNVTISGGEPFQQPAALSELVCALRVLGVRHILVYTGYTWEELLNPAHGAYPYLRDILENIDVLVDGRFVAKLDDPLISWRGSRNQRPIDVAESLAEGRVITLDWEAPRLTIQPDGSVVLPQGLEKVFASLGESRPSRMCGESR